jgi:hypothetical protein
MTFDNDSDDDDDAVGRHTNYASHALTLVALGNHI